MIRGCLGRNSEMPLYSTLETQDTRCPPRNSGDAPHGVQNIHTPIFFVRCQSSPVVGRRQARTTPEPGQRQDTTALDADAGRAVRGRNGVRGRDGVREGDGVRGKGRGGPGVMGDTPGPVQSPPDVSHEDTSPMRSRGHQNGERRGSDVGRSRPGGTI